MKNSLTILPFALSGLLASFALTACEAIRTDQKPRTRTVPVARTTPPERGYDVAHYAIDLVLYPERESIEARCRVRFAPTRDDLDRIDLDLVGLDVRTVSDGRGVPLDFFHDGQTLRIELDAPIGMADIGEVVVGYDGQPTTGLWFSGTRPDGTGPTQVFTQGQAEHNRGWFPCFDHPSDRATSEIRVTMPPNWISVAPGDRIDQADEPGTRVEHWRMLLAEHRHFAADDCWALQASLCDCAARGGCRQAHPCNKRSVRRPPGRMPCLARTSCGKHSTRR